MTETATVEKSMVKKYINPCITIVLMLLGYFVPAPAPITEMGMAVIFTFAGMIYGWSTCGMLWPSLLGIVMLGFTGYVASPEAALGLMLTNTTFVASLVAFVLFAYVNETGLLDVLSTWVVTRKFAAGKPWMFMTFFFFALGIIGPFAGNPLVLILLGFNFAGSLLKQMGYTKEDPLSTYMMLGVSLLGLMAVWPFFMPSTIYTRGVLTTSLGGHALTAFQYIMCIAVPSFLSLVIFLLVGRFVLRIDTKKFAEGSQIMLESAKGKVSINDEQKRGATVLLLFALGMVLPAVLPQTWPVIGLMKKAGIVGVSIILTVALLVIYKKDGKTISDFATMMQGVSWDMLMLTGAIMVIATALLSEGTGVAAFLAKVAVPLLSQMSIVTFVIAVCVFMCIISQFSMNMVLQMIFAPILAPLVMAAGYNPLIAVLAVYFGTQFAYLAPSGSMMAALVFGNTEWVDKKNLYKICVPWIILSLIMAIVIALTFPNIFCANLLP